MTGISSTTPILFLPAKHQSMMSGLRITPACVWLSKICLLASLQSPAVGLRCPGAVARAGHSLPFNPFCVSDLGFAPRGDQCHNRALFPLFRDAGQPFIGGGLGSFEYKIGIRINSVSGNAAALRLGSATASQRLQKK